MKATVEWKVYGRSGAPLDETQNKSFKYDFSVRSAPRKIDTRIIEVLNHDKTGTHDYAIVRITRNTIGECYSEFYGQLTDGIFENYNAGSYEIVSEKAPRCQLDAMC